MTSPHEQSMHEQSVSHMVPMTGEDQLSPEQAQALERVRQIYHTGSQPLTVARARYDLIRRGVFDQ